MSQQYLYRFYDANDELLYVGVTSNPWSRFKQHSNTKLWWNDVVRITTELHASREAVLVAEKQAIKSESPKHNVIHNGGWEIEREPEYGDPLKSQNAVALCMRDGECYVGQVQYVDDVWVTVTLKSFLTGLYDLYDITVRIADIQHIVHANADGRKVYDEHLGKVQTQWESRNHGGDQ